MKFTRQEASTNRFPNWCAMSLLVFALCSLLMAGPTCAAQTDSSNNSHTVYDNFNEKWIDPQSQGVSAHQLPWGLVVYDNFDERFLDPTRWSPYGACFTWSVLECVREIQDHRLRLAVRNYGATNSNQGVQYGPSELHFSNPTPVRSIATKLVVRRTSSVSCPANTTFLPNSHAHTVLQGNFFNSGSGNSVDDVQGLLIFDHASSDPKGVVNVAAFMHWQSQFFGFVDLGSIVVGQTVIAELSWDQPHSQFVASWTDAVTGKMTQAFLPYTMPDTTPPAAPDKLIGVRTWAPNCISRQMSVTDMEATFDRVWIGN